MVDVVWIVNKDYVSSTKPSDRIYTAKQRSEPSTAPSFVTAFVFACKTTRPLTLFPCINQVFESGRTF